jgi:hypothetical protein
VLPLSCNHRLKDPMQPETGNPAVQTQSWQQGQSQISLLLMNPSLMLTVAISPHPKTVSALRLMSARWPLS